MLRVALTSFTLCLLSFTTPGAHSAVGLNSDIKDRIVNKELTTSTYATFADKQFAFENHVEDLYQNSELSKSGLSYNVFRKAYIGFQNFKQKNLVSSKKSILTVIDFTKSSREKRMWIIDLKSKKVLYNTLVAHGRNTGESKAMYFSNQPNSYMSSMGFYITNKTYVGKHGLSLKLSGMDKKYNSNAMERAIVVHGADYVSESFVKQYGRLGRSLGCPAVPVAISKQVIELIKDNTCLYIHSADKNYTSSYLNPEKAIEGFALENAMLAYNK
ncbi:murein L,D-transpeptidase catalytic domain family protein [Pontibacter vulgaris]|uniref:murein L,D-transpeptidase catalytic domain family protein n=1 Tax=Pontibacter vulgaris TaxID=2905679 RepID=UPI001FA71CE4|nr:murein L,D-transpeptidase catalytic domain family protein [Pontibacter vulgaris]